MKNKGTIKFFAIALAVVSLFHLSFTLKTYLIEKKAAQIANGNVAIEKNYLDSLAFKPVYNVLVRKYTYAECKEREINLGLDLQGGMHVTLEVAVEDLVKELSGNNTDKNFNQAIKLAKEKQRNGQQDFITYFVEAFYEIDPGGNIAIPFATLENKDEGITINSSRADVVNFLQKQSKSALESTFEVIRKRIDKFGVTQPNIQLLEGTGRILIELPGVDDPERVRKLLQGAAKLEFWETYASKDIIPMFEEVNKEVKNYLDLQKGIVTDTDETGTDEFFSEGGSNDNVDGDLPLLSDNTETDTSGSSLLDQIEDTSLAMDSAANQQLTAEQWNEEYPFYGVLQPNIRVNEGKTYYTNASGPVVGVSLYHDTATVNRYLALPEVKALFPPDVKFAWGAKPIDEENTLYQLIALKITTLDRTAPLDGKVVTNARVDISPLGEREVGLRMNSEGAKIWKRLTGDNIGKSIAIMLDGLIYSFPTVQSEIAGGSSQITGGFTNAEAQDLSNILNSGKLDVRVNIIEEAVVGPSLGRESINSGLISLLAGFLLVIIFMIIYYNRSGYVADLALMANLFFIIGVLSSLQAALTLPGIAGIVLTIGMSVDANVLIFERIREELAAGKGLRLAIKEGYLKAYSSIIDANVTTLLVAIVLYTFGTGPIHGFATILIIGILTSLFSAILITRIIFDTQLTKEKNISFSSSFTNNVFRNVNLDFLGWRRKAYLISGTVIILGIASLFTQGLEMGVDFKGGYSMQVRFNEDVNTTAITNLLTEPLHGQPEVKTFGPKNQVKITTSYMIDQQNENATDSIIYILNQNLPKLGDQYTFEIMSTQVIGPTIADDIKVSALWSVIFALLIIFIYIFIRFRRWQFGLSAVLTLFHDTLIILSIFSIFRKIMPFSLEIDQSFIAAILTIIGYSINDTVVVFDRIREKLTMFKHKPFMGTVNTAINETLSRTVITSLTTLVVVLVLFIFGGEIIRGFAFALTVGIIVGTYSSIFVSTPIVVELVKKEEEAKRDEE